MTLGAFLMTVGEGGGVNLFACPGGRPGCRRLSSRLAVLEAENLLRSTTISAVPLLLPGAGSPAGGTASVLVDPGGTHAWLRLDELPALVLPGLELDEVEPKSGFPTLRPRFLGLFFAPPASKSAPNSPRSPPVAPVPVWDP